MKGPVATTWAGLGPTLRLSVDPTVLPSVPFTVPLLITIEPSRLFTSCPPMLVKLAVFALIRCVVTATVLVLWMSPAIPNTKAAMIAASMTVDAYQKHYA